MWACRHTAVTGRTSKANALACYSRIGQNSISFDLLWICRTTFCTTNPLQVVRPHKIKGLRKKTTAIRNKWSLGFSEQLVAWLSDLMTTPVTLFVAARYDSLQSSAVRRVKIILCLGEYYPYLPHLSNELVSAESHVKPTWHNGFWQFFALFHKTV